MMFRKSGHSSIQSELFNEHSFFRAFSADIKNAKREVLIESPYITVRRASEFSKLCPKLMKKGVQVHIRTRNPNHHSDNLRKQALLGIKILIDAGAKVSAYDDLRHRKLAIIDSMILWEGSLNMLSHSNSKEIMRRDVSPVLCSKVLKLTAG